MTDYVMFVSLAALLALFAAALHLWISARRYERAAKCLETDIETMSSEIQRRLRVLLEAEKLKMLDEERQRIMRDVHDGLGGLLVRAVALTDGNPTQEPLREVLSMALNDLRLIVDSLGPADDRLGTLLANYRHLHNRMYANNSCTFEWQIDDLSELDVGPTESLSILRIIQEALTNVVKHANAQHARIVVRTGSPGILHISIDDDGNGRATPPNPGKGIESMRKRAQELGGELSIESGTGGTAINLVVDARAESTTDADEDDPLKRAKPDSAVPAVAST